MLSAAVKVMTFSTAVTAMTLWTVRTKPIRTYASHMASIEGTYVPNTQDWVRDQVETLSVLVVRCTE